MCIGEYITFTGGNAEEAEEFIVAVKRRAYSKGKHTDNVWIAHFVSVCFEKKALRWYESLDDETQNNWKLLKRAILEEYKETSLPPSIIPTPASALESSDKGPIPAAASPFRIGRIRVECDSNELRGYISNTFHRVYWCSVSPNQSTAATFEFDALARTIKFQASLWELEATACTLDNRVYLAKNHKRFATHYSEDYYKPATLYFETLS
ncbi:hypothetical protein M407DRAFT_21583 [Tulasnella calospora MUT 4182]|uniref:Retrotransposon gag domain-containing protein n=1 Tax=Tulasnella calospora MUT 4182 TaxID=1051891 RepID=A0A0C3M6V3_9AGAM|nr:hypothetical protein M407DRAFT_21583 [Tulasnella calospora MUT 4182]